MSIQKQPDYDDFQASLTFKEMQGFYPWEIQKQTWEADSLDALHRKAMQEAKLRTQQFPDGSDFAKELEATRAFAEAARLIRKTFKLGTPAYSRLMRAPDGQPGGLLGWAQPDWNLVLYCAKLLRYIALAGQYEMRAFTVEERLARDVREKRHAKLLDKWEVLPF